MRPTGLPFRLGILSRNFESSGKARMSFTVDGGYGIEVFTCFTHRAMPKSILACPDLAYQNKSV
jgi:hypothetical protein